MKGSRPATAALLAVGRGRLEDNSRFVGRRGRGINSTRHNYFACRALVWRSTHSKKTPSSMRTRRPTVLNAGPNPFSFALNRIQRKDGSVLYGGNPSSKTEKSFYF